MKNLQKNAAWLKKAQNHEDSDLGKKLKALRESFKDLDLDEILEFEQSIQSFIEIKQEE